MPIEYKAIKYGCKYKCGKKHSTSRKNIEEHEKGCWYNPKNRTCKTCKHEYYFIDKGSSDDYETGYMPEPPLRECKINNISEAEYNYLIISFDGNKEHIAAVKPKVNCSKWEAK